MNIICAAAVLDDPDCLEDLCVSYVLPQEHVFDEMRHAIEQQRARYLASPYYQKSRHSSTTIADNGFWCLAACLAHGR